MYNYFLLRGGRAILREVVAGWLSLTIGSLLFGVVFAKYSTSGEGAAFVAASVVSIPVALILLQAVRMEKLRLPDVTIPKGSPAWKKEESEGYGKFRESLDPEAKAGLRWVTGMVAANALFEPQGMPIMPFDLSNENIEEYEERSLGGGKREVRIKIKGKPEERVILTMDRRRHLISYGLAKKEGA